VNLGSETFAPSRCMLFSLSCSGGQGLWQVKYKSESLFLTVFTISRSRNSGILSLFVKY
jgi:hypothetical protein